MGLISVTELQTQLKNFKDKGYMGEIFPDYFGVKNYGLAIIHKNDIINDDYQIRVSEDLEKRGTTYANSFNVDIDWTQPLPVVQKMPNSNKFTLMSGYGRQEGFDLLNQDHYIYQVVSVDKKDCVPFRAYCNRRLPSLTNEIRDLEGAIIEQVEKGFVKPGKNNFTKFLNQVEPFMHPDTKKQIVANMIRYYTKKGVLKSKPKSQRFRGYKSKTIMKSYINKHWASAKSYGFRLKKSGEKRLSECGNYYTGVLPIGYEHIKIIDAILDYAKTGIPTKFVVFQGNLIKDADDLEKMRINFLKNVDRIIEGFEKLSNSSNPRFREAFEILGFVPQEFLTSEPQIKELVKWTKVKNNFIIG